MEEQAVSGTGGRATDSHGHAPEDNTLIGQYHLMPLFFLAAAFLLLAVIGSIFTPTHLSTYLRLLFGLYAYLILPGYLLLINIELDALERLTLSTAIGISLIPLVLFNLNLYLVKTTPGLVWGVILTVSAIGVAMKWTRLRSQ